MYSKNKGITLVALVITIILLLILVGITISQLVGSGLLEKAKQAKDKSENAAKEENRILDEYEQILGETRSGSNGTVVGIKATPGDGTKNNPYIITTVEQLQAIKILNSTEGVHVKLGNDIDLSSECSEGKRNWTPIGTQDNPFKGEFDGNGKSILNLYINSGTANVNTALFGYNEGTIRNLNTTGTIINTQGASGIVYENKGTIENCINNIDITNNTIQYAAGIVIQNYGVIKKCTNKGNVLASKSAEIGGYAGIAGVNRNQGVIEQCINEGIIEGYNTVGGIAGTNQNQGIIKECINKQSVNGNNYIGGIAGHNIGGGRIYNSYNVANVTGPTYIGGIAGYNGYVGKCYIYN